MQSTNSPSGLSCCCTKWPKTTGRTAKTAHAHKWWLGASLQVSLMDGDTELESSLGGKVCKSHGFSWGLTAKQKSTGFEIPFPCFTYVSYTLQRKPFNEGKGLVPLKACITQGVGEDALGAMAIDLFWVCTEPESFSFPCSHVQPHSHKKVDVIWHSYNIAVDCLLLRDSAVADVARSCYGPWAGVGHQRDTACTFHYWKA